MTRLPTVEEPSTAPAVGPVETPPPLADGRHAEFPDDPLAPPNDYWILDVDPRLRTLSVSPDVRVRLVRLSEDADADLDPGTWTGLPDYLAPYASEDGRLWPDPFWIEVTDGVVTSIEEQYLPWTTTPRPTAGARR